MFTPVTGCVTGVFFVNQLRFWCVVAVIAFRILMTHHSIKSVEMHTRLLSLILPTVSATAMGQLPILEVDGVELAQCDAILRYLAEKYGGILIF